MGCVRRGYRDIAGNPSEGHMLRIEVAIIGELTAIGCITIDSKLLFAALAFARLFLVSR